MKPIGSITAFYRFLDAEDRSIMDDIMLRATDYVDYVHLLGRKLLETKASPKLVHVCARLARPIEDYGLIEQLGEKYPENDLIRPHYIWARVRTGSELSRHGKNGECSGMGEISTGIQINVNLISSLHTSCSSDNELCTL